MTIVNIYTHPNEIPGYATVPDTYDVNGDVRIVWSV